MSGPVANGMAQLEDALTEMGLVKGVLILALMKAIRAEDDWQRRHPESHGAKRIGAEDRQQLWDHIAVLLPDWTDAQLVADELDARHENEQRRRYGRDWARMQDMSFGRVTWSPDPQAAADGVVTVATVGRRAGKNSGVPPGLQHDPFARRRSVRKAPSKR